MIEQDELVQRDRHRLSHRDTIEVRGDRHRSRSRSRCVSPVALQPPHDIDVRGDLTQASSPALDRTTIGLYLEQGYAVLSNRQGAREPTILEVPLEEVLTSSSLGNPTAAMLEVLEACGGAI